MQNDGKEVQGVRCGFTRGLVGNPLQDKIVASIGLLVYGVFHAFFKCLEMFTLHVVLTSSSDGILSFMFYNNFSEVKITVFKKMDAAGIFSTAVSDSAERLDLIVYMTNILMTTSQNRRKVLYYCLFMFFAEVSTDNIKHFFLTRHNNID